MKKTGVAILILLLSFTLLSPQKTEATEDETGDIHYSLKSTVTYSNPVDGNFTWDLAEDDRTIGLFMNNSWQNTELKSVTYSLSSIKNDEDGNKIGLLELPKQQILPGENLSFTTEYEIVAKSRSIPALSESEADALNDIPSHLVQEYAAAEGPWAQTDLSIQELARDVAGNQTKVLEIVKALIEWIKGNITYGTHEIPLYANQTAAAGVGDCDDQAILLVALLRTLGIPSYLQIGAIYIPDYEVSETHWNNSVRIVERKVGWHGWAVVYIPPWGWLPVDLTYVPEGFDNPLNAIRQGAVTQQNTVQYMNISRVDYIADSAEARSFLIENGFQVYLEDEMTYLPQDSGTRGLNPLTSAILIAALVAMSLLVVFIMIRSQRRKLEKKPLTES
jgi:transglutaminase-like putative cysteine protease